MSAEIAESTLVYNLKTRQQRRRKRKRRRKRRKRRETRKRKRWRRRKWVDKQEEVVVGGEEQENEDDEDWRVSVEEKAEEKPYLRDFVFDEDDDCGTFTCALAVHTSTTLSRW